MKYCLLSMTSRQSYEKINIWAFAVTWWHILPVYWSEKPGWSCLSSLMLNCWHQTCRVANFKLLTAIYYYCRLKVFWIAMGSMKGSRKPAELPPVYKEQILIHKNKAMSSIAGISSERQLVIIGYLQRYIIRLYLLNAEVNEYCTDSTSSNKYQLVINKISKFPSNLITFVLLLHADVCAFKFHCNVMIN